jgi:hypothetical protein
MQTKSARIMKLYAAGKTTREIADIVGCRQEYVRVVARQRKGGGMSEIDRRYEASPKGAIQNNKRRQRARTWYHAVPKDERSKVMRGAYAAARRKGKSVRESHHAALDAARSLGRQRLREAAHA